MKKQFEKYLRQTRQLSENSVKNYLIDYDNFENFTKDLQKSFKEIDARDIEKYKIHLKGGYKNSSINRKIASVRELYKFLYIEYDYHNPTQATTSMRVRTEEPTFLSKAEIKQAYEKIYTIEDRFFQARATLILDLFLTTGIRREEITKITTDDIDFERNLLKIIGKGNKPRVVGLSDRVRNSIHRLNSVRKNKTKYLITSKQGNPLSVESIHLIVKKTTGYSPHKLRHTTATMLYDKTKDIRLVQDVLGHSNIATTQIYTHIDKSKISESANVMGDLL